MIARILLSCCLIVLSGCKEVVNNEPTPEYWAETIMAEGFSEDLYQRYRAVLDAKPLEERHAFRARVNELRGIQEAPPIQDSDYISYEEAYPADQKCCILFGGKGYYFQRIVRWSAS